MSSLSDGSLSVSAKFNFADTESDQSDRDDTYHLSMYPNFDGDVASFDKTTDELFQKNNFCRNVLEFVLGCIPSFDDKNLQ